MNLILKLLFIAYILAISFSTASFVDYQNRKDRRKKKNHLRSKERSESFKNEISNQTEWLSVSQEGEWNFWMQHWDDMVNPTTKREWKSKYSQYFYDNGGFNTRQDFLNKRVLDVGSGPRPLAYSMDGILLYVIEPLGDRFLIEAEKRLKANDGAYLEIQKAVKVYSSPAESLVPELIGSFDVVLSTNSLDHTWDPTKYLRNCMLYLKENGYVYLIVDLHNKTEPMHPEKSLVPTIMQHIYDAGLRFDRGSCLSAPAYPALAFNSCWFILSKNKDYTSTP